VVNDLDPARADAAAESLRAAGLQALAAPFDVTVWDAVSESVQRVVADTGPSTFCQQRRQCRRRHFPTEAIRGNDAGRLGDLSSRSI